MISLRILALSETKMASFCAIQCPFHENFAKLFSKAGNILKETISMTGNQLLFTLYLTYGMNLTDRDFSIVDLIEALKDCRSSSFDNDMIHVTMLKQLGANMKNLLLFLFNTSWITSTWPWNISRITPIKKPGKKSYEQCSSHRPLSISSHVGKLFERKISARLKLYFETHNILDEEQEGFRTHRNTTRSLFRMHLVLKEAKRSKKPTAPLNFDLEKAFDSTVNLPHMLLCIITSFLSERKGFFDINGHYTEFFDINVGLPQGSVLSPVLYIFLPQ